MSEAGDVSEEGEDVDVEEEVATRVVGVDELVAVMLCWCC